MMAAATESDRSAGVLRGGKRRAAFAARREALTGLMFLAPWAIGFTVFIAGPMVASLVISLTRYDVLRPPQFIGVGNYVRMVTSDPEFWGSLARTFYFATLMVPAAIILSLCLALLLNR